MDDMEFMFAFFNQEGEAWELIGLEDIPEAREVYGVEEVTESWNNLGMEG